MNRDWTDGAAASRFEDGPRALREWRWRCYLEHLEDLGYDLGSGRSFDDEIPADLEAGDWTGGAPPSAALR